MKIYNKLEIFIIFLSSVHLSSTYDLGVCFEGNLKSCCPGYHLVNDACEVCPPGSYGKNCSLECPNGTYGSLCKEECTCETGCDKVIGCIKSGLESHSVALRFWHT
ncbi:cell death abnormality protein 1-like [Saccostrea cucullata]|uniref:cell death abnormality protein 1-like n=1 Tax=Saccostrea cuccullata TaxID=36930 RepID=UPI002ED05B6E